MYDWIPMEFDYDILFGSSYARYHCIANDEDRYSFKVFVDDNLILSKYERSSLIDAMNAGSKINGMTMEELKEAYYAAHEVDTIDISALL